MLTKATAYSIIDAPMRVVCNVSWRQVRRDHARGTSDCEKCDSSYKTLFRSLVNSEGRKMGILSMPSQRRKDKQRDINRDHPPTVPRERRVVPLLMLWNLCCGGQANIQSFSTYLFHTYCKLFCSLRTMHLLQVSLRVSIHTCIH